MAQPFVDRIGMFSLTYGSAGGLRMREFILNVAPVSFWMSGENVGNGVLDTHDKGVGQWKQIGECHMEFELKVRPADEARRLGLSKEASTRTMVGMALEQVIEDSLTPLVTISNVKALVL